MVQTLTKEDMLQSLQDLGCSPQQMKQLMYDFENHHFQCLFYFLKKKRFEILEDMHQKQKQIDHLDYLIYILKNHQAF